MPDLQQPFQQATHHARRAIRPVSPWVEPMARVGYVAKGIVYAIIGALAVQLAIGSGGRATDSHGAMHTVLAQPLGNALLAALATGLFGYGIWRLVQAVADPEHRGEGWKGAALRAGYAGSGILHVGLAVSAIQLVLGARSSGGGSGTSQHWTARVLDTTAGPWIVGAVGLGIIAFGVAAIARAIRGHFAKRWTEKQMGETTRRWALRIARTGVAARGVVFMIIGGFVVQAARHHNAGEVRGLGGALQALLEAPFGTWLLGIVALGLVAYGLYLFVEARYRRIAAT